MMLRRNLLVLSCLASSLFMTTAYAFDAPGLGGFAKVLGAVEGVEYRDNQYYVKGWACQSQVPQSIGVELYINNTKVKTAVANLDAEASIVSQCTSLSSKHRFSIPITYADIQNFAGKTLQVKAVNTVLAGREMQVPSQVTFSYIAKNTNSNDVTIPKGVTALIDGNINKGNVVVNGVLACPETGNFEIKTNNLIVQGEKSKLVCGSRTRPFLGKASFIMTGKREYTYAHMHDGMPMSGKTIKGMMSIEGATIEMVGKPGKEGFVRLAKAAVAASNVINLTQSVKWEVGDNIAIASTSLDYKEAETAQITQVSSDGKTITLNKPLQFNHWGGAAETFNNGKTDADAELSPRILST